jgi:hypothetical protein
MFLFITEYNFTKKLDLFLIMRRVLLVRLLPVTVDDGINVHVSASYLPYFLPFSNFVMFLIFILF